MKKNPPNACFLLYRKRRGHVHPLLNVRLLTVWCMCLMLPCIVSAQEKFSVNFQNIKLEQAISQLQAKCGCYFVYNNTLINPEQKVSVHKTDASISEILAELFADTNIRYSIDDKQIVLYLSSSAENTAQAGKPVSATTVDRGANTPSNNSMQSPGMANVSQSRTVRGTVMDETGFPLPGAAIVVKGNTKKNTTTNGDGKFELTDVEPNAILVTSLSSYETTEYALNGRFNIEISLKSSSVHLLEVVITGYQTISKERATGAYTMLDSKLLEQSGNFSLKDKLEGLVPGLYFEPNYVEDQSPTEESSRSIIIRGASTFGDNNPLIVIDGFPASSASDPWKSINPNDVESITVLKDAAASSIWGAQAANGVIVITTKRGQGTTPRIDASVDFFAQPAPNLNKIPWASSEQAVNLYKWMAFETTYWDALKTTTAGNIYDTYDLPPVIKTIASRMRNLISDEEMNKQLDQMKKIDVRNEFAKLFFNKFETNTKANLSFQVGNSQTHSLRASLTGTWNQRYNKGNSRREYNINVNEQYSPAKWITVSLLGNIALSEQTNNGVEANDLNYINQMTRILDDDGNYLPMIAQMKSTYDSYYAPGTNSQPTGTDGRRALVTQYKLPYDWDWNLKREVDNNDNTQKNSDIRLTAKVNLKPINGLNIELSYQYQNINQYFREYYNEETWTVRNQVNNNAQKDGTFPIPPGGMLYESKRFGTGNNYRALITYDKAFGNHSLRLMAGTDWRRDYYDQNAYGYYGYDPQALTYLNTLDFKNSYTKLSGVSIYYSTLPVVPGQYYPPGASGRDDRYVAYYANGGYSFANRYDLNGSIRLDKTNLYGAAQDNPNLPQWSVGVGWTISNEEFIKHHIKAIDYLRLRATYGWKGNISKAASPYLYAYPWTDPVLLIPYSAIQSAPNPALTWEKTAEYNVGLDYAFLSNTFSGSVNFYIKHTDDVLVQLAVNGTYGFQNNRAELNGGVLENKGLEITVNANIFNEKNFKWQTQLLYSTNRNTATNITTVASNIMAYTSMAFYYHKPDQPISYLAAIKWAGYDDVGLPQFMYDEKVTKVTEVADINKLDMNKLFTFVGQKDPKHFGSWINNFIYKNLELGVKLYYKFGHKVIGDYPPSNMFSSYMTASKYYTFLPEIMAHSWKSPEDANTAKMYNLQNKITNSNATQLMDAIMAYGTQNVYNASSVRLQSISLSYALPQKVLSKIGLKDLRIVLEARNLGPIIKFTPGFDPDNVPYSSSTYGALMYVVRNRPEFSAGIKIGLF